MSYSDKSISEQICEAVAQLLKKGPVRHIEAFTFYRGSGAIGAMVDAVDNLFLKDDIVMITTYIDFPEHEAEREEMIADWEYLQERKEAFEARRAEIEEEGGDPDDPENYDDDVWMDSDEYEQANTEFEDEYGEPEYQYDTYELSALDECDLIHLYRFLRDYNYDLPDIEGC